MTHATNVSDGTSIRELGAYYTPPPIVRFMLQSCFDGPLKSRLETAREPLRILDPACGDGAFLREAVRELEARFEEWRVSAKDMAPKDLSAAGGDRNDRGASRTRCGGQGTPPVPDAARPRPTRLAIVRNHLFGVDVDAQAIERLMRRVTADLVPHQLIKFDVEELLRRNFRVGNSLTGGDFETARIEDSANGELSAQDIHWSRAFPHVAAAGGFDLVIGNPPYCREKGARLLFQRLAETELGRRWRQPRMDLWHYFLHRGLDLLRADGVLCYIVNTYWMAARSARPMIERLREETTVRQVVLLGDAPIFDGVSGRHMILQVEKGVTDSPCHMIDLSDITDAATVLRKLSSLSYAAGVPANIRDWRVPQQSLYDRGRFAPLRDRRRLTSPGARPLGERFDVRQGIAENPPFVTRAIHEESGGELAIGQGIFVLSHDELAQLALLPEEQKLLRPYFSASAVRRYRLPRQPTHWILYVTRRTAPDIAVLPNIADHLVRVRSVLVRRREVQRGLIAWWHLHWPREERLFTEPRVLAVQMCRQPEFVYVERPSFVGFSLNVVRSRTSAVMDLPAVTAVLNSRWAAEWFAQHAKRRGVGLDISGTLLREFPLPTLDAAAAERLTELCLRRQELDTDTESNRSRADTLTCHEIESEIDELVVRQT